MVVLWAGFGIGASAVESLLLARHGADILPPLFIALGPATIAAAIGLSTLLAGRAGALIPQLAPLAYSVVVLALRPLAGSTWRGAYPVLWVLMMVLWLSNGITAWALAGRVHDTRQAKRLFPLYAAGVIVGGVVGGLTTPLLASLLGVPNLLFVWAVACALGYFLARGVGRGVRAVRRRRRAVGVTEGVRTIRGSALLRWMAVAIVGFALLYFALTLLFARGVVDRYPDPPRLAGFLGAFVGTANAVTLVVSLFVANRLFARFGAAAMIGVLTVIYAASFGVLSFTGSFVTLSAFRFLQIVWVYGVWSSGWQALLNVVPAGSRDAVRAFLDAGAYPVGVAASGAVLLAVDAGVIPGGVPAVGIVVAVATAVACWFVRRSYADALVDALRTGNPDVFGADRDGGVLDRHARAALLRHAGDPDPGVRRVAVHLLARQDDAEAHAVLARATGDPDGEVRRAAIGGLAPAEPDTLPLTIRAVDDDDPAVRAAAARSLASAPAEAAARTPGVRELLSSGDPGARASAAAALMTTDADGAAVLSSMLTSSEATDRLAAVSAVAAAARARSDDVRLIDAAVAALGDPDPAVRGAAVDAARAFGPDGADRLVAALSDPVREASVLEALPTHEPSVDLRRYITRQRDLALADAAAVRAARGGGRGVALLRWALDHRARDRALRAVAAAAAAPAGAPLAVAAENLRVGGAQQADALETLDAVGERGLVRPLVSVWEHEGPAAGTEIDALEAALDDPDPMVRAAAVLATSDVGDTSLLDVAKRKTGDDAEIVREAARMVDGDGAASASALSLVERVMFLRGVPLFEDLSPDDLLRVAEVATEEVHPAASVLAEEGEVGDELHIVVSGAIRVVHGPSEIATRGVGEYVGEMAIVSDQPRMASLVAGDDARTLTLDGARFRRILRERPDVGLAVMRVLCDRLRESDSRGGS